MIEVGDSKITCKGSNAEIILNFLSLSHGESNCLKCGRSKTTFEFGLFASSKSSFVVNHKYITLCADCLCGSWVSESGSTMRLSSKALPQLRSYWRVSSDMFGLKFESFARTNTVLSQTCSQCKAYGNDNVQALFNAYCGVGDGLWVNAYLCALHNAKLFQELEKALILGKFICFEMEEK